MQKIPVGATIAYAYRFAFGQALIVFKAVWLPLIALLVVIHLLTRRMALFLAAAQAHDPSAPSLFGPLLLLFPLMLIFFFAQFTAATELALGKPPQSWFANHFSRPMWRLMGSFLFALAAIFVIYLLYFIAILAVGALAGAILDKPVSAATYRVIFLISAAISFLIGLGIMAFAVIRFLFLLAPISVVEQKGLPRAWELSKGNFWRALLVTLTIMLPVAIINYTYATSLAGVPQITANMTKEAREAAEMTWRIAQMNAMADHWYITLPLAGLLTLFQLGAGCAAQAFAYRKLTENSAPVAGDALPD
jgi:hypothetical protein